MPDSHLFDVTLERFEEDVLEGDIPVLVEFGATWCGPCRALEPILEKLAEEMGDTLDVGQADVDTLGEWVDECNVQSVPTLILFQNGEELGRHVGVMGLDALRQWVQGLLTP